MGRRAPPLHVEPAPSYAGTEHSKDHAVCDGQGRPRVLLLTEGQVSDYKGAATMLPAMPSALVLIADRGYDADWFQQALRARGTRPLHPGALRAAHTRSATVSSSTASAARSRSCSAG